MDSNTESPSRTTAFPIPDQWLLVGLLVVAAILSETSFPDVLRLPLTIARFVATYPDNWMPLLVMVILMAAALVLERSGPTAKHERPAWFAAGTVAIAGVLWFFRAGDLDWHATPDWTKEWAYYTALHESLSQGRLPWFLNETFQGTDRFFANPETNIAPQAVLLAWMDVSTFVVLQCVMFVVFGIAATYQLARDLRLGPVASMAFLAVLLMNGHLTAHFSTGHGQWVSYFAFPGMFLFVHRAAMGDMSGRSIGTNWGADACSTTTTWVDH